MLSEEHWSRAISRARCHIYLVGNVYIAKGLGGLHQGYIFGCLRGFRYIVILQYVAFHASTSSVSLSSASFIRHCVLIAFVLFTSQLAHHASSVAFARIRLNPYGHWWRYTGRGSASIEDRPSATALTQRGPRSKPFRTWRFLEKNLDSTLHAARFVCTSQ